MFGLRFIYLIFGSLLNWWKGGGEDSVYLSVVVFLFYGLVFVLWWEMIDLIRIVKKSSMLMVMII